MPILTILSMRLKKYHTISIDWRGGNYCGLTVDSIYDKKCVDVSMPGYTAKALHRFQHPTPKRHQHAPHDLTSPAYGSRFQYSQTELDLPTLDPVGMQRFQSISGTLLYYYRSVNPTMLPDLNYISMKQSKPTAHNITKCNLMLDHVATYPDVVIGYHKSDMILNGDTDGAYLVLPKARIRIAGHFYISNHPPATDTPKPKLNGPVLTLFQTQKNVVASAVEAEIGGMFLNG